MGLDHVLRSAGTRSSVRNLRTGWIALATFLALIALSALLVAVFSRSTRIADELAREDERVLVTRYLDQLGSSIIAAQKVQLTWDDAMRNAVLTDNEAWANHFLGDFVWNNLETDAMFLVKPDGTLVHGWAQGRRGRCGTTSLQRPMGALRYVMGPPPPFFPVAPGRTGLWWPSSTS